MKRLRNIHRRETTHHIWEERTIPPSNPFDPRAEPEVIKVRRRVKNTSYIAFRPWLRSQDIGWLTNRTYEPSPKAKKILFHSEVTNGNHHNHTKR